MAEPILYMAPSGAGKTTSLHNLDPETTVIITPNAKSLPFPGGNRYVLGKNRIITNDLIALKGAAKFVASDPGYAKVKVLIMEDFTHFFSARIFSQTFLARNTGNEAFQRWTEFGADVYRSFLIDCQTWREDLKIVVLAHTEIKEDGTIGFKSAGKLLDNTIDFPSYFTYVFHGIVIPKADGTMDYLVQTNKDTVRQAKTPYGLFAFHEKNDMRYLLDRIQDYQDGKIEITFK